MPCFSEDLLAEAGRPTDFSHTRMNKKGGASGSFAQLIGVRVKGLVLAENLGGPILMETLSTNLKPTKRRSIKWRSSKKRKEMMYIRTSPS